MGHPVIAFFAKLREAMTMEVVVSVICVLFVIICLVAVAGILRRKRRRAEQAAKREIRALYVASGRAVVRRDRIGLPQVKAWKEWAERIAARNGIAFSDVGIDGQKWDKWIAMARERMHLRPPANAPNAPANVLNPDEPGTPKIAINTDSVEEEFFTITVEEPPPSAEGEPEEWNCREAIDDEFIVEAGKKLDSIMAEREFQKELSFDEKVEGWIEEMKAAEEEKS